MLLTRFVVQGGDNRMVFTSQIFVFYFLPLALALFYVVAAPLRLIVLTALSYAFYGWANPWFLLVLLWSTIVDFCCGNLIYGHWRPFGGRQDPVSHAPGPRRKVFLAMSLFNSLGTLFAFKYLGFFEGNLNAVRLALGLEPYRVVHVLLPAGISFYTFESISYVVDIYQGRARPASVAARQAAEATNTRIQSFGASLAVELRGLLHFACYLAQFPHLVAGPIIRFQDLEPQMFARRNTPEKFSRGIVFFCLGFAKKVLIADTMGEVADFAFSGHPAIWSDAWLGLFGFAFQIYFDFSGYSDMAIGLGLMFGFEFAKNFDAPYQSGSITEFWRRWHISLSSWLRDYLYIGLGGNRRGEMRTYVNLMTVMLLGGLWHGASWTFVIWGGIHGAWLVLERLAVKKGFHARMPRVLSVAVTFFIVCIAWIFFRSATVSGALSYLAMMFRFDIVATPIIKLTHIGLWTPTHLICLGIAAAIAFLGAQTWDLARRVTPATAIFALMVFWGSILAISIRSYRPFLYFRF